MAPYQLYSDSPHTPHPEPCHNCLRISCHSLHSYSTSNCPYDICAECLALQALDAQITDIHNLLVDLSNKRRELKSKINHHHDPLTHHLPVEVISHIFTIVADIDAVDEYQYYYEAPPRCTGTYSNAHAWNPALRLGAVCKRWREITLATPRLWTNIRIDVSSESRAMITDQWLSRSRSLPLSLDVYTTKDPDGGKTLSHVHAHPDATFGAFAYPHTLREITSTSVAGRWKDLTLRLPMTMVRELFSMLPYDGVVLDSLSIQNSDERYSEYVSPAERESMMSMSTGYSLIPQRLHIHRVPLQQISVDWGSLAHFEATNLAVDSLIHVLRHAHRLDQCIVHHLLESADNYPISPITNVSITQLQINTEGKGSDTGIFLSHSTLPSLQTLRYGIPAYDIDGHVVDVLSNFLHRSHPLLHEFFLHYFSHYHYERIDIERDWYRLLPSITHLHLNVDQDSDGKKIQGYIERLGYSTTTKPLGLPSLRELDIKADRINCQTWDGLAAMFQAQLPQNSNNETIYDTSTAAPLRPISIVRPLKAVTIHLQPARRHYNSEIDSIPPITHSRLRAVQKSGVTLKVFRRDITNIFEP